MIADAYHDRDVWHEALQHGRQGPDRLVDFILADVKHLSERKHRPLRWAILESVKALIARKLSVVSTWVWLQAWWNKNIPGWAPLQFWIIRLEHCGGPCCRTR